MKVLFDRVVLLLNAVALGLVGLALVDFVLHPLAGDFTFQSPVFRAVSILILTPLTLLAAFMIIRRVPGNIVGPLLVVWCGTVAYNSIRVGMNPFVHGVFFAYDIIFGWLALFLMFLHFPDGKIYPPAASRWIYPWLLAHLILTGLVVLITATLTDIYKSANPFYLPILPLSNGLIEILALLSMTLILLLVLVSQILRYKNSTLIERQQIKWLALFGGANALYCVLALIVYPLLTGTETMNPASNEFGMLFYLINGLFPPLAIGLAVLRYRLWDIDRIIRRTLVYAILTVALTLIYFGSVVLLQTVLGFLFQLESSNAAIILSTLAIAALFTPLRLRIQQVIDRRFYRQKYDAEKVLAAFSATARDETNLDHLTDSILAVVNETMQPAHLSLQIKDQPADRQR